MSVTRRGKVLRHSVRVERYHYWRASRTKSESVTDENEQRERDPIAFYTAQYSQAVQAFETIRVQSDTFQLMGNTDELRSFLDQFIEMASRTAADAHLKQLDRIAGWFMELVQRAEQMRHSLDEQ